MKNRLRYTVLVVVSVAIGMGAPRSSQAQSDPAVKSGTKTAYVLVPTAAKRLRAELTFQFQAPKLDVEEWTVYIPSLPELPGQLDVRSALSPHGVLLRENSDAARAILGTRIVAETPRQRHELQIRVAYEATLLARKLVERAPKDSPSTPTTTVAPLDTETRRLALLSGSKFDYNADSFQKWLAKHKLLRDPEEGEIDFARRVFLELKKTLKPAEIEAKNRFASIVCESGTADARGMTIAFVSALRANRIPARLLMGRKAESSGFEPLSKKPFDPVTVTAEFHAPGVGWVPADIASGILRDESPEGLTYFGNDEGNFVAFHVDTDFLLDTYFGRETIEWFYNPSFWSTGAGSFDGQSSKQDWKVQTEPLDLAKALERKSSNKTAMPPPKAKMKKTQKGKASRSQSQP